jgi:DUF3089 family protein
MKTPSFITTFIVFFSITIIISCARVKPLGNVADYADSSKPDYSDPENWAALPNRTDSADQTPHPDLVDLQQSTEVDIFFLHPTTYLGKKGENQWNAPIDDDKLNQKTDESSIKNQASIFNGAGRVYAPRYRQAHYENYFTKDTINAKKAFHLAYLDTKAAFEYYLEHYNNGRPIIIAAHSQGTTHAATLLKDFFDGKPLQNQLVAAYLVGMPISTDYFKHIKVCETPEETGCFCSWRTWKKNHLPKSHNEEINIGVTNPLNWKTDSSYAPKKLNEGSVLRKFEKSFYPGITDAKVIDGVLWITKPKFPGSFLVWFKNYHIADYNLFYVNVRKNAQLRATTFLNQTSNRSR